MFDQRADVNYGAGFALGEQIPGLGLGAGPGYIDSVAASVATRNCNWSVFSGHLPPLAAQLAARLQQSAHLSVGQSEGPFFADGHYWFFTLVNNPSVSGGKSVMSRICTTGARVTNTVPHISFLHGEQPGLGDAASDLSIFNTSLTAADALFTADQLSGSYGDEISAYQAAGNAAVAAIGPQIDSSQSSLAQQASSANDQLQTINATTTTDPVTGTTSGPASSDAQSAHDLAHQMASLYGQAIAASPAPVNLPPPPVPTPNPSGGSSGGSTSAGGSSTVTVNPSSTTKDFLIAGGVAAAAYGGWWWWKKHKRGRR